MKTNTLESKRQRDALEKKIQCVDDSASVASSNIQLYMQPNKKKCMYMYLYSCVAVRNDVTEMKKKDTKKMH